MRQIALPEIPKLLHRQRRDSRTCLPTYLGSHHLFNILRVVSHDHAFIEEVEFDRPPRSRLQEITRVLVKTMSGEFVDASESNVEPCPGLLEFTELD